VQLDVVPELSVVIRQNAVIFGADFGNDQLGGRFASLRIFGRAAERSKHRQAQARKHRSQKNIQSFQPVTAPFAVSGKAPAFRQDILNYNTPCLGMQGFPADLPIVCFSVFGNKKASPPTLVISLKQVLLRLMVCLS
jgi:hypothetical protein